MQRSVYDKNKGFTLVEILIVVVILGILAAIVVPQFGHTSAEALHTAFVTSLNTFLTAESVYRMRTLQFLENSDSGQCPAGFDEYMDRASWERLTPIGGVWDAELNSFGIISAIGVHFNGQGITQTSEFMLGIDRLFDDGDLTTGKFRQIAADRYYYIIRE